MRGLGDFQRMQMCFNVCMFDRAQFLAVLAYMSWSFLIAPVGTHNLVARGANRWC